LQKISVWLFALLFATACERIYFFTTDTSMRENFYSHEDAFIAFAKALDAHPEIEAAQNCPPDVCFYPDGDRTALDRANKIFVPHLNNLNQINYIFFKRNEHLSRVKVELNRQAGRRGDYSVRVNYIYWPEPDNSYINCKDYIPPNEDFYYCHAPLKHGWMIERSGVNEVKFKACLAKLNNCLKTGGTQKSCIPAKCSGLITDW